MMAINTIMAPRRRRAKRRRPLSLLLRCIVAFLILKMFVPRSASGQVANLPAGHWQAGRLPHNT
jgi:hypothetical protein